MTEWLRIPVLLVALLLSAVSQAEDEPLAWEALDEQEQRVLQPFREQWAELSSERQQRLQVSAVDLLLLLMGDESQPYQSYTLISRRRIIPPALSIFIYTFKKPEEQLWRRLCWSRRRSQRVSLMPPRFACPPSTRRSWRVWTRPRSGTRFWWLPGPTRTPRCATSRGR